MMMRGSCNCRVAFAVSLELTNSDDDTMGWGKNDTCGTITETSDIHLPARSCDGGTINRAMAAEIRVGQGEISKGHSLCEAGNNFHSGGWGVPIHTLLSL